MRVGYGLQTLSLTPGQSKAIVADAKRRFRLHNAGRRHVEASVFATIADSARVPVEAHEVREQLRHATEVVDALERMCAVLTQVQISTDIYGSGAAVELARGNMPSGEDRRGGRGGGKEGR